jgi:hypothetical protein
MRLAYSVNSFSPVWAIFVTQGLFPATVLRFKNSGGEDLDETDLLDVASSKASKKCYLTVLAAIGIKEGAFGTPAQAISFLRDGYRDHELGELAL